jgi:hypothetical protein
MKNGPPNDDHYPPQTTKKALFARALFCLGRIVGIEPMHGRFTAGCVKPLHHIRQRVIVYSTPRESASAFKADWLLLDASIQNGSSRAFTKFGSLPFGTFS